MFEITAQVAKAPELKDVKDRPYQRASFWVHVTFPSRMEGDELLPQRTKRCWVGGSPEVARQIEEHGLHVNEMIKMTVVEFGSFCKHQQDRDGKYWPPANSLNISSFELLSRPEPAPAAAKAQAKAAA